MVSYSSFSSYWQIKQKIAIENGVGNNDVEIITAHRTTRTLDVIINKDVSEEKAIEAAFESISEILDVHPKTIRVTIADDSKCCSLASRMAHRYLILMITLSQKIIQI